MIKKFLILLFFFLTLFNFLWAAPSNDGKALNETASIKIDDVQILNKKIEQLKNSAGLINDSLEKINEALAGQELEIENQVNQIKNFEIESEKNKTLIKELTSDIEILNLIKDYYTQVIESLTNDLSKQKTEITAQADRINAFEQQAKKDEEAFEKAVVNINKNEMVTERVSLDIQNLNSITVDINNNLGKLNTAVPDMGKRIDELRKNISENKRQTDSTIEAIKKETVNQKQDLKRSIYQRTKFFGLVLLVFLILILSVYIVMAKKLASSTDAINKKIKKSKKILMAESLKTDTILTDLIEKQLEILKQPALQNHVENEPDHSLALQVGQEIHRMRKRISNMPEDTKGIGALKNSLNRLEEQFNANGYELIDLMGKPYVDGLSVKARFIPSDELNPGEKIITKIINPQINFNGVLIQAADVEVSTGD